MMERGQGLGDGPRICGSIRSSRASHISASPISAAPRTPRVSAMACRTEEGIRSFGNGRISERTSQPRLKRPQSVDDGPASGHRDALRTQQRDQLGGRGGIADPPDGQGRPGLEKGIFGGIALPLREGMAADARMAPRARGIRSWIAESTWRSCKTSSSRGTAWGSPMAARASGTGARRGDRSGSSEECTAKMERRAPASPGPGR